MHNLIGIFDYIIISLMLIISAGIGIYYKFTGGKQRTVREYLFADKRMSVFPTAGSLTASFLTAVMFLGLPSDVYKFGFIIINIIFAYPICTYIITNYVLPKYLQQDISTPFEYLSKRFGYTSQILISVTYLFQTILTMGIILYGPSIALEKLIGIQEETAILLLGGTCIFYSTIGGMKAVIMTDVFQAILMLAASFTIVGTGLFNSFGNKEIWDALQDTQRLTIFNFDLDPSVTYTTINTVLCGATYFLTNHIASQSQVQRYLSVKDLGCAQKALWISTGLTAFLVILNSISGIAVYAHYYTCDPEKDGRIRSTDQIIPLYIIDVLSNVPGLTGIMISGVFSGSLSTLSSGLNALSTTTVTDYIKPFFRKFLKRELNNESTLLAKSLVVIYGVICILSAAITKQINGIVKAMYYTSGILGGPVLGIFLLGLFTTTANEIGTISGFLFAMAITAWISFGGPKPPPTLLPISTKGCTNFNETITSFIKTESEKTEYFWLYKISYIYVGTLGVILTCVFGLFISFCLRKLFAINKSSKRNVKNVTEMNQLGELLQKS